MKTRFPLSGFADEISPDLAVQITTLKRLGVSGLDLRGVDGKNVLDLTPERLLEIKAACETEGLHIACIGSPVNKVDFSDGNRRGEMAKLEKSIAAAKTVGVQKIRVFTPHLPEGQEESLWPETVAWMREMADLAKAEGVILLHENDAKFIGAYPKYARRLFEELGAPHFRAVYDFANGVPLGFRPLNDWFPWLLPHLDSVHIKDATPDGKVMPAGEGEGDIRATLEYLMGEGWSGTLSLEPHLQAAGKMGGFSGPELFEVAVNALRKVVSEAGGEC